MSGVIPVARIYAMVLAGSLALVCALLVVQAGPAPLGGSGPATDRGEESAHGPLPMSFEPNVGQTRGTTEYLARGPGYLVELTGTGATLDPGGDTRPVVIRLERANTPTAVTGIRPLDGKVNYYVGREPADWRTGIPTYGGVRYGSVYPGIDAVFHGHDGRLEYDFVVAPGADPDAISLRFGGVEGVSLTDGGDVALRTDGGRRLINEAPVAFQRLGGGRERVPSRFDLTGDTVGFRVGAYDRSRPLVIDPAVFYSTLYGGGQQDAGVGVDVDGQGAAYVAGHTQSVDFPATSQCNGCPNGGHDAYVAKIAPDGKSLVYASYFGGESGESGQGVAVDQSGNAYVSGSTTSGQFPATAGSFDTSLGGAFDAFAAKFDSSGALVYSTYLGGSRNDWGNAPRAIDVDSAGAAYVFGSTQSEDFPVAPDDPLPAQPEKAGGELDWDFFVTKVSPSGQSLVYSTFLGGADDEGVEQFVAGNGESNRSLGGGIYVAEGNAYVAGTTFSANYPNTLGAPSEGVPEVAVTKLCGTGVCFEYSLVLSSPGYDQGQAIAVDSDDNAYVVGTTNSSQYPAQNAAQPQFGGGPTDGFVTKLSPNASPLFSSFVGGSKEDHGYSVAVDDAGRAYVAGTTNSADLPLRNPTQEEIGGEDDAFAMVLNAQGGRDFATYIGGEARESAEQFQGFFAPFDARFVGPGIAVDSDRSLYLAGPTLSKSFPTTDGAYQEKSAGDNDGFVAKIGTVADVAVVKSDSPDPAQVGDEITYTLTVTNHGPAPDADAVVIDELPDQAQFVSASAGCTEASHVVTCELGLMDVGQTKEATIVVRALSAGELFNFAEVKGAEDNPNFDPAQPAQWRTNSDSETTTVEEANADVSLVVSDGPDPIYAGEETTLTLVAQNDGPDDASDANIAATLPDSFEFVSAPSNCEHDGGTVHCVHVDIPEGGQRQDEIIVKSSQPGLFKTGGEVRTGSNDPNLDNNEEDEETQVLPRADLVLEKTDEPDPAVVGEDLTYTLTVRNEGPDAAEDVELTDSLPTGVEFVGASDGCAESGGTVTCELGGIAAGSERAVEIVVRPGAEGTIENSANVEQRSAGTFSPPPDPGPDDNLDNNRDSEETTVVPEDNPGGNNNGNNGNNGNNNGGDNGGDGDGNGEVKGETGSGAAPDDGGTSFGPGSLPFTGALLVPLLVAAGLLVTSGHLSRRVARRHAVARARDDCNTAPVGAQTAANGPAPSARPTPRRTPDAEVARSLVAAIRDLGPEMTQRAYSEWRGCRLAAGEPAPVSASLIARRCGGWRDAVTSAAEAVRQSDAALVKDVSGRLR